MSKLATDICFAIARRMIRNRKTGAAGENPATFTLDSYQDWRDDELRAQFTSHFALAELAGRDVVDFGCGGGALSVLACRAGAKSVVGVDLNSVMIQQAQDYVASLKLPVTPQFSLGIDSTKIERPDDSADVILCFDVLEHILDYEAILAEWPRVLRRGGKVLIWWVPWFHPYGHHIESLVPIPWGHVVFSERTLIETCARIYDLPEFKPRWWDLDEQGRKKPNKWRTTERFGDLNRLTIARFERHLRQVGLQIETREVFGFGSSALARLTRGLTHLPLAREFFCSRVIYRLVKG